MFGYNKMILKKLGCYFLTRNLEKYMKESRNRDPSKKDVILHFSGTNYIWLSHDCYKGAIENDGKSELRLRQLGELEPSKVRQLQDGKVIWVEEDPGKIWLIFECEKCSFKARLQICLWGKKLKRERDA